MSDVRDNTDTNTDTHVLIEFDVFDRCLHVRVHVGVKFDVFNRCPRVYVCVGTS